MDQLGGYSARLETWFDTEYGAGGKTLVFKADDVRDLADKELFALCRNHRACPDDEPDEDFTITRDSKGFTFVNFGMERVRSFIRRRYLSREVFLLPSGWTLCG